MSALASPIIIASLMRLRGPTGVQTHMREFKRFLEASAQAHVLATPFHALSWPFMALALPIRHVLEWCWKPAAVWLYRSGHGAMLGIRLAWLMSLNPRAVVYAQCPLSAQVALCLARRSQRVVMVVHFNGSQADEWVDKGMIGKGGWMDRRIKALEARMLSSVHRLVFVSDFVRQDVFRMVPAARAVRSEVIPNFIRAPQDDISNAGRPARDIVNIGTLEPRKNQGYLIAVVAEARRRGHDLTLTLVGDGGDRARLERQVKEMAVSDLIIFEGYQPNGRDFIPGHRLYVHAARMESQGIVLLEAFSMGVPVLAPEVGGIPEVVEVGQQGQFWPLDDVPAACTVLLSMLAEPQALSAMGRAASQRFARCYEASVVADRLLTFLVQKKE